MTQAWLTGHWSHTPWLQPVKTAATDPNPQLDLLLMGGFLFLSLLNDICLSFVKCLQLWAERLCQLRCFYDLLCHHWPGWCRRNTSRQSQCLCLSLNSVCPLNFQRIFLSFEFWKPLIITFPPTWSPKGHINIRKFSVVWVDFMLFIVYLY